MSTPLAHIVDDDEAIRDALTWLFRTKEVRHCGMGLRRGVSGRMAAGLERLHRAGYSACGK